MGLFTSQKTRDKRENDELYRSAASSWEADAKERSRSLDIRAELLADDILEREAISDENLQSILSFLNERLLEESGYFSEPVNPNQFPHDLARMYDARDNLRRSLARWHFTDAVGIIDGLILAINEALLSLFPHRPSEDDDANNTLTIPLIDCCENMHDNMELIVAYFFSEELRDSDLFPGIRNTLRYNLDTAAEVLKTGDRWPVVADAAGKMPDREIVELFFRGTPFQPIFNLQVPFSVSLNVRTEHTHVVGGSGHGKTQCLQHMMISDLERACEGGGGFCVIDSQGDMINTISRLEMFAEGQPLADRLVIVDPNDIERPPALNMFDIGLDRFSGYSAVEQEKIVNGSIELYEYIFGALLGAELTSKQNVIFKFLARYMLTTPGATIHTLREFVQFGSEDTDFSRVDPVTRDFFRTQFFTKTYADTRNQVATRLWGVLSNSVFERMFSAPKNKVDLFGAMNSGKIVLINTAKDLLKSEGCSIFGRFFIAMIAQASLSRAVLPKEARTHFFVLIDEAQDYFDDNIENLLNQSRKYNVGLLFAHQNLGQLTPTLKASIMASTASKFCGGVNASDATAFSKEMRCSPDFILNQKKTDTATRFATYIKNVTPSPVSLTVPFGAMEKLPCMSESDYQAMRAKNTESLSISKNDAVISSPTSKDSVPENPSVEKVSIHTPVEETTQSSSPLDDDDRFSVDIGRIL